jgi:ribosomal protein S18 acetylase RimI-like enzyme
MSGRYIVRMIRLEEKSPADFKTWMVRMWDSYYQDLVNAGTTPGDAQRNLDRNKEMLFDGDVLVKGHFVFNALDGDTVVGVLWIADKLDPVAKDWYIYDIEVDEVFRGKGYGRLTMQAAEEYVTGHGGKRLGLNVFGFNTVARSLYESMDYKVLAVGMYKDFS